jgi:hypothetical protein
LEVGCCNSCIVAETLTSAAIPVLPEPRGGGQAIVRDPEVADVPDIHLDEHGHGRASKVRFRRLDELGAGVPVFPVGAR